MGQGSELIDELALVFAGLKAPTIGSLTPSSVAALRGYRMLFSPNFIYPADASQGLAFYSVGASEGTGDSSLHGLELVPLH